MLSYWMKCGGKKTENKNPRVAKITKEKNKCFYVCDSKISRLIKEQEASGLLNSLWIGISLNQLPIVGPLLF